MCNYQGYEFGAGHYVDSECIEGYLYDSDSWDGEGFTIPAHDEFKIPCPKCNKKEHTEYLKDVEN